MNEEYCSLPISSILLKVKNWMILLGALEVCYV